jgi:hypothetical protein
LSTDDSISTNYTPYPGQWQTNIQSSNQILTNTNGRQLPVANQSFYMVGGTYLRWVDAQSPTQTMLLYTGNNSSSPSCDQDCQNLEYFNTGSTFYTGINAAGNLTAANFDPRRSIQVVVTDYTTNTATGDGQAYFTIDSSLAGKNLVDIHARTITAGVTGTTDIQIHNVTQAVDMLSTKLTIDSGETGSDTAATPAVIDTANDDVALYDLIRIDIDAISSTPAQGLIITLGFDGV